MIVPEGLLTCLCSQVTQIAHSNAPHIRLAHGTRGVAELTGTLEPGACIEGTFTLDVLQFGDIKVCTPACLTLLRGSFVTSGRIANPLESSILVCHARLMHRLLST